MKHQNTFNGLKCRISVLLLAICLTTMWLSCRKNEEPPIPVGKPIKYTGQVLVSIDSALQRSPYKLFYAAWKRAGMDSLLVSIKASSLTIYAPTDSAFTAAGYTASNISTTSKAILDSLLSFHVVLGTYVDSTMTTLSGSTAASTLLKSSNPQQSAIVGWQTFGPNSPYTYSLFIATNGGFSINGKQVKTSNKNINARYATIYPINQVLQRPTKDIYAMLSTDQRFSYLMTSYRLSDSVVRSWIGYNPSGPDSAPLSLSVTTSNITLFAPTNDAFKAFLASVYHKSAGSVTMTDLRNYINRKPNHIEYFSKSPIDSVISVFMVNYSPSRNTSYLSNRPLVTGSTWLYSDLLYNSAAVNGYVVTPADRWGNPAKIIDLDFIHTGIAVQVKRYSSNTSQPVNIIQHDIMATNGVLHIVDGLLKP